MSLLDNASLVLTPNAYKEGKLYSVIPSNGNGDFTATRATTATRVNSSGLVDLVPYNLVSYSEMFTNAVWNKQNATISANVTTAPDGTLTADKLVADATLNQHRIYAIPSNVAGVHSFSCYAKAGEYNFLSLATTGGIAGGNIIFNLTNGTFSGSESGVTPTIQSVGNGWYRCSIQINVTSPSVSWWIIARNANNTSNYTGNGTDGLFIWGAQLVEGTSARDYLRTETRLNIPRIDYSLGGCPNILLEPQRTNSVLQSSSFDSATWAKPNISVTANSTTSPSGITDADKIIPNTSNAYHSVVTPYNLSVSSSSITASVYLKADGYNFAKLIITRDAAYSNYYRAVFNLSNGTVVSSDGVSYVGTQSITSVGNGWYRCVITVTNAAINNIHGLEIGSLSTGVDVAFIGNGTSGTLCWGAQFEVGAYATSYIPTTTASVTRNADSITRNNIFTNGLITAAGGTWFVELRNNVARARDIAAGGVFINTGTAANINTGFSIRQASGSVTRSTIFKVEASSGSTIYTTTTDTCKIAIKWNGSTADVFENGVKVVSATAFTATNMEYLIGEGANRQIFVNEMALFPTPLTDAQCIALTQ